MDETLERFLREEAVERWLQGESSTVIARNLNRSREWVHVWINRFDPGEPDWSASLSRAPRRSPGQLPKEIDELVIAARHDLAADNWLDEGPVAIRRRLIGDGLESPPSPSSIKRILRRNGLAKPRRQGKKPKVGTLFPAPPALLPGDVHEADFIGERFLVGGALFYLLVNQDRFSHLLGLEMLQSRGQSESWPALLRIWSRMGVPERLKFDNHAVFCGDLHPGGLMRACLWHGVTPVFVPYGEPWRNGLVETTNGLIDERFIGGERFPSLEHLRSRLAEFERARNSQREPAAPRALPISLDGSRLPSGWPERGRVEFIRLVRSNLKLNLLRQSWPLPKELSHSYVTAILDLAVPPGQKNLRVVDAAGRIVDEISFPGHWEKVSAMS